MFNHVGQAVTDLDRTTRFYVEALGFHVERDLDVPDEHSATLLGLDAPVDLHARYLRCGELVIELMSFARLEARPPRVMNEPGLTHLSVSVEDFEGVADRVESLGGEVLVRLPNALMIRDPDGQRLEILTKGYFEWAQTKGRAQGETQPRGSGTGSSS